MVNAQSLSSSTLLNKKVPWLPRGTLTPIDHDKNDFIVGWREKIELLKYQPFDPSKITMTIKNQAAAKQAFENYAKQFVANPPALSVNGAVYKK